MFYLDIDHFTRKKSFADSFRCFQKSEFPNQLRMSKDRTVIHKVPVYSIEGILGLKDESPTSQNKSPETVIQNPASRELKESSSESSPDKIARNGKLVRLFN